MWKGPLAEEEGYDTRHDGRNGKGEATPFTTIRRIRGVMILLSHVCGTMSICIFMSTMSEFRETVKTVSQIVPPASEIIRTRSFSAYSETSSSTVSLRPFMTRVSRKRVPTLNNLIVGAHLIPPTQDSLGGIWHVGTLVVLALKLDDILQ